MNTGAVAAPAIVSNERIGRERFTGATVANTHFRNCDFSGADLTGTTFVNCVFYDADTQAGYDPLQVTFAHDFLLYVRRRPARRVPL